MSVIFKKMRYCGYIETPNTVKINWDSPGINVIIGDEGVGKTTMFKVLLNGLFNLFPSIATKKFWFTQQVDVIIGKKTHHYRIGKQKGNKSNKPSWLSSSIYTFQKKIKGEWVLVEDSSHRSGDTLLSISKVLGIKKSESHLIYMESPHADFLMSPALLEQFINTISGIEIIEFLLKYIKAEIKSLKDSTYNLEKFKVEKRYILTKLKKYNQKQLKENIIDTRKSLKEARWYLQYQSLKESWQEYRKYVRLLKKYDLDENDDLGEMLIILEKHNKYEEIKNQKPKKAKPKKSIDYYMGKLSLIDRKEALKDRIEDIITKLEDNDYTKSKTYDEVTIINKLSQYRSNFKLAKNSKKGKCIYCKAPVKLKSLQYYIRNVAKFETDLEICKLLTKKKDLEFQIKEIKISIDRDQLLMNIELLESWKKWYNRVAEYKNLPKRPSAKVNGVILKKLLLNKASTPSDNLPRNPPNCPDKSVDDLNIELGRLQETENEIVEYKGNLEDIKKSIAELLPYLYRAKALEYFKQMLISRKDNLEDSKNLLDTVVTSANNIVEQYLTDKELKHDRKHPFQICVGSAPLKQASSGQTSITCLSILTTLLLISPFQSNILLIDEPTRGMRTSSIKKLKLLLRELQKSRKSLWLITHSSELEKLGDSVYEIIKIKNKKKILKIK